jgi:hypothetical protein
MIPATEPPTDRREAVDDLYAQIRQAREQAETCRYQAQVHEARLESAMMTLAESWHGDRARQVMRGIDDAHVSAMSRFARQAQALDERSDELWRAVRAAPDDARPPANGGA